jgi:uncharacterized membrane protein
MADDRAHAKQTSHGCADQRLQILMGTLLRAGVTLSAALVLAGGLLYLDKYGQGVPEYRVFRGEPSELRHVSGVVTDARALQARGVIQLGLLILIATPIARVLFSVVAFAAERDWLYLAVTLVVLGLLIFSASGG